MDNTFLDDTSDTRYLLEEKFEPALNKMYSMLLKIIKILEEQKEQEQDEFLVHTFEGLCTSAKELKEEVDAVLGAIYEVLPLYVGDRVVIRPLIELEEKYFRFIKELYIKFPDWCLMLE